MRTLAVAVAAAVALATTGCGSVDGLLHAIDPSGDGPRGVGETQELFAGVVDGHSWAIAAATSADGPVVTSSLDGEPHSTSWNFAATPTREAPLESHAGVPHEDGSDIESPLIDLVFGYATVHQSVDEVVLLREGEVLSRTTPIAHPWADFSLVPVAGQGIEGEPSFFLAACRDGRQVGLVTAYSWGEGSSELPDVDPC